MSLSDSVLMSALSEETGLEKGTEISTATPPDGAAELVRPTSPDLPSPGGTALSGAPLKGLIQH